MVKGVEGRERERERERQIADVRHSTSRDHTNRYYKTASSTKMFER
jgi:hypothetical protein